jgi:hypothetical protein
MIPSSIICDGVRGSTYQDEVGGEYNATTSRHAAWAEEAGHSEADAEDDSSQLAPPRTIGA